MNEASNKVNTATNCMKCGWEIVTFSMTDQLSIELWGYLTQDMKLFAVKKLVEDYHYSHREAKGIIDHLNKEHGKCMRCDFDQLAGECATCPKCNAFNYNLDIEPSFNQEFCAHLEWKLDFDHFEECKGFWCDGIDHLPQDIKSLTKENIQQHQTIETKAWAGNNGQDVYEMTIFFGEKAIENYISDKQLIDCIPDGNCNEWVTIDPVKKQIGVQLF